MDKKFSIKTHSSGIEFAFGETNQKWALYKWLDDDSSKIVIAFFDSTSDGYNMRTVGNRFFEYDGAFLAAKRAMQMLVAIWEMEEEA
jgi:hypothetical protein